jgi:outer membrane protein
MSRLFHALLAGFFALVLCAQNAVAEGRVLAFSLTTGARVAPLYSGAGDNITRPMAAFGVKGVQLGSLGLGAPDGPYQGPTALAPGRGLRGALRMLGPREGRGVLSGMDDIDRAFELGIGLHHTSQRWQIYADLRHGVIGHRGISGEAGANLIWRSDSGQILHGGPRAEFGNARYMRSYFGVTNAEVSKGAAFTAYRPGGGIVAVGLELGAYQPLSPDWGITGSLRFDRLRGNAAASPIVQQGSRAQLTSEIGLTRHFNLRF